MDDLEVNPLYKAFLGKFGGEFDIACKMSYLIAIPHSDSLEDVLIDQFFANSHILMPSKLLKMHYTPLQVGYSEDVEEIEGNKLLVHLAKGKKATNEKMLVNILDQEIDLNSSRTLLKSIFVYPLSSTKLSNKSNNINKLIKPPKPLTNHDNCLKYLEFISQELTMELESEVKKLQSRYMILSQYLEDAAGRIKNLSENFIPRYEEQLLSRAKSSSLFRGAGSNSDIICDGSRRAISLAVENYVVYLLHGKLIASLYQQHEKEDKIMMRKFELIQRNRLSICQLGAQAAFSDFILTEEIRQHFLLLPSLQSPISMVDSLVKVVHLITEQLNQSVRSRDHFGNYHLGSDSSPSRSGGGGKTFVCSDDLIASFVYSLARAKPAHLYSTSKYLETFGFSSSAKEQAAYYTATFQIVIRYIFNFTPETHNSSKHSSAQLDRKERRLHLEPINLKGISEPEVNFHQTGAQIASNRSNSSSGTCTPPTRSDHRQHKVFISDSLDSRESTSTE